MREDLIYESEGRESGRGSQALLSDDSSRMKASGQKLMGRTFHLNMRKKFFTVQVTKHRLPRKILESLSLQFKKLFGHNPA